MAENSDRLIRFLLPEHKVRGLLIHADAIVQRAGAIHGLTGAPLTLFGQSLIAAILLLGIGKGGVRQVLQIDGPEHAEQPIRRILAEARAGRVRGYMDWHEGIRLLHEQHTQRSDLNAWMGAPIQVSTVRDLGFGQPYISTIRHDSPFLADHLVHYLNQSVQVRADLVLQAHTGLLIEAMPACSDAAWFQAVEAMAAIPDQALRTGQEQEILAAFASLGCKVIGRDAYTYRCACNADTIRLALASMPASQWDDLADMNGNIQIECQYCHRQYSLSRPGKD